MTQFNDISSNKDGLLQSCEVMSFGDEGYGRIANDANLLAQFTNRINRGMDRFAFLAMTADGRWQWDDSNYTDLAIGQTNIVATQRNYTFSLEHLEIEKVLIQNSSSGLWAEILPIDEKSPDSRAYFENNAGRSGTPSMYDKRGDTLWLDFTPNYSQTNGIKVYFKRGPSYFTVADTTKKPGFASIFHNYPALYASAHYAIERSMPQAKSLFELLQEQEKAVKEYYSKRNLDERPQLKPFYQNNK